MSTSYKWTVACWLRFSFFMLLHVFLRVIFMPSCGERRCVFRSSVRPSVRPLTPVSRDAVSLYLVDRFHWKLRQITNLSCEWAFLKTFSRSWGQRSQVCECYNGGGIHFDGVMRCFRLVVVSLSLTSSAIHCLESLVSEMTYYMSNFISSVSDMSSGTLNSAQLLTYLITVEKSCFINHQRFPCWDRFSTEPFSVGSNRNPINVLIGGIINRDRVNLTSA